MGVIVGVCHLVGVVDGARTRFVGLDELPQWSPEWAATMAATATGLSFDSAWAASDRHPAYTTLKVAAEWSAASDDALDARVAEVADAGAGRAALIPPVMGVSFAQRKRIGDRFAAAGLDVAEIAAAADSPFGLRLVAHLRDAIDEVATRVGRLATAPERTGAIWRAMTRDEVIEAEEVVVESDALIPDGWVEQWRPVVRTPVKVSPWLP